MLHSFLHFYFSCCTTKVAKHINEAFVPALDRGYRELTRNKIHGSFNEMHICKNPLLFFFYGLNANLIHCEIRAQLLIDIDGKISQLHIAEVRSGDVCLLVGTPNIAAII